MKINYTTNQKIKFDELENGNVFIYEDTFYIKVKETYDCNYNAVRLVDGMLEDFVENCYVTHCDNHVLMIN